MLSGLPACGKSSYARDTVTKDGNTGRVNRDDLRAMIFNGKWSGAREKIVIAVEKAIAKVLLERGQNVIVDDTNLTEKNLNMWEDFAEENHVCEFQQVGFNMTIDELEKRDMGEGRKPVGRPVIERLALESGRIQWTGKPIVLVDVDGTLADCEWRREFAQRKEWDKFFERCYFDYAIETVCAWVRALYNSGEYEVVILSGRPDTYGIDTVKWLRNVANVEFHHIFMRRGNDKRPDTEVKSDIMMKLPWTNVKYVIDDRQCVVDMWREFRKTYDATYSVFQVAEGNF